MTCSLHTDRQTDIDLSNIEDPKSVEISNSQSFTFRLSPFPENQQNLELYETKPNNRPQTNDSVEYYLHKSKRIPAPKFDKRIQGKIDGSDLVTVMTTRLVSKSLNF